MNKPHIEAATKSQQVKERLLKMLDSDEYRAGEKLPTEPELSQLFGVSRNTLREAISNLVTEGRLRKKQGQGTFALPHSSITTTAGNFVGLCYPVKSHSLDMIRNCQEYVIGKGGLLVTYNVNDDLQDPTEEKMFLENALAGNLKGVVVFPSPKEPRNTETYRSLRAKGVRVVLIAPYKDDMSDEVFFGVDFRLAGYFMAAKAATGGFDSIILVSANMPPSYVKFLEGIKEASEDLGISALENIFIHPNDSIFPEQIMANNPESAGKIKNLPARTAVVTTQIEIGHTVYEVLRKNGRRIPEDVGLVSFYSHVPENGPDLSSLTFPAEQILLDALDYVMDDGINATEKIQKSYKMEFEERGTLKG